MSLVAGSAVLDLFGEKVKVESNMTTGRLGNVRRLTSLNPSTVLSSTFWNSDFNAAKSSEYAGIVVAEGRGEDKVEG